MEVKYGAHRRTKAKIKSLLADKDTRLIAVAAAAIYFEWAFRRFVCVFGRDPVKKIEELFNDSTGGYPGYRRIFLHELDRPKVVKLNKKGKLEVTEHDDNTVEGFSGNDGTGLTMLDVIKGWTHLSDNKSSSAPVRLRNEIVHGSINSISLAWATHAVNAYLAAIEDLEKFCSDRYESLFLKLRNRSKWEPNTRLKKAIKLVQEDEERLNDQAYATRQLSWITLPELSRRGEINLKAYRRRKKNVLDHCKLCKVYLTA